MSVANEVRTGPVAEGARPTSSPAVRTPWWERPALFRYGFALILIVWKSSAFHQPVFLPLIRPKSPPPFATTMSVVPYFLGQARVVIWVGRCAVVNLPLGIAMARIQWRLGSSADKRATTR